MKFFILAFAIIVASLSVVPVESYADKQVVITSSDIDRMNELIREKYPDVSINSASTEVEKDEEGYEEYHHQIDVSKELLFVSSPGEVEFSNLLRWIKDSFMDVIGTRINRKIIGHIYDITIDGSSIEYPKTNSYIYSEQDSIFRELSSSSIKKKLIVINPGHGYYEDDTDNNTWKFQRQEFNGVLEDLKTIEIGEKLEELFNSSVEYRAELTRSKSTKIGRSGKEKYQECSQEYLRDKLKDREDIWNTASDNTNHSKDINCRPYYANYLNADLLISIHTNGNDKYPDCFPYKAKGTKVIYSPNNESKSESKKLARKLAESLSHNIQNNYDPSWYVEFYEDDHGENRESNTASVIIEVAYHDCASDATALKNSNFIKIVNNAIKEGVDDYYNNFGQIEEITMDQAFSLAESRYGADLGTRSTETHCWSDPGYNPSCIGGVRLRDYIDGSYGDGDSAVIYNPSKRKAYLVSEGFWGYYKLFEGYKRLGPPTGDVVILDDGGTKQKFENGYLIWSPKGGLSYPDWDITQYDNNHEVVYPNGGGAGTSTQPTPDDPPVPGLPDFITDKVTLANQSGSKEKYTWKINETAYVHSWTDNIGDADWEGSADKIKVPFYLSKGTKEDSHSEWKRIAREQIQKKNLKRNKQPKHEYIKFRLQDWANDGTIMPGRTYNFVVCADRPKDENNGDGDVKEKHKSNNCSTEAVFYVDYGPARNVDLMADMLALTGGRTQLQAGEKYGLQLEVSNIGTEQPWNGFLTSYEMKGPSTGNAWQKIGEDTSKADSLYPGAIHFEAMDGDDEIHAPMVGGDYVFRACTDYTQAVPETDESNNCTAELPVYVVPPPMPDLITEGLQLTHGRTGLIAGELYGLTVAIRNIGDAAPSSNIRSSYEIKGPGTGDAWQFVADDGSDADELYPGASQWEEITDEHGAHIPAVPGTYTARACADYQGNAAESDESNNCSEMTFEVGEIPADAPRIVITNPTHTDTWRSSSTAHDIRWEHYDFPGPNRVMIEYSLDGGASWMIIDDDTNNDKVKHWDDMCDFHTIDTDEAMIRITSLDYPYVYDVSDEFTIDHAKECE